ncbi:hypothetical protein A0H81_00786 [Grifola frondosa]|uniref:Uncharacterized protein n=1 Tax=Grifola frondosa TaxID=5627 RepID=A0A1C7MP18_GRIFR|nr:hypothetical protein A0H81_00786 [Grifola frondosa]
MFLHVFLRERAKSLSKFASGARDQPGLWDPSRGLGISCVSAATLYRVRSFSPVVGRPHIVHFAARMKAFGSCETRFRLLLCWRACIGKFYLVSVLYERLPSPTLDSDHRMVIIYVAYPIYATMRDSSTQTMLATTFSLIKDNNVQAAPH